MYGIHMRREDGTYLLLQTEPDAQAAWHAQTWLREHYGYVIRVAKTKVSHG